MIERTGEGVLGFITNHGYLDNPTFRGMRWHLLKTFDKIWVIDLHGNAKKKEVAPDGSADKNVFDIQQGVAIIIGVKRKSKEKPSAAKVEFSELWGTRQRKYQRLLNRSLESDENHSISPMLPYSMFYPVNPRMLDEYDAGFSVASFFPTNQKGVISARDHLVVAFEKDEWIKRIEEFRSNARSDSDIRKKFFGFKSSKKYQPGDTRGWSLSEARKALLKLDLNSIVCDIFYRPFDKRVSTLSEVLVDWPRTGFMRHFSCSQNIGLSFNRGIEEQRPYSDCFVFAGIIQHHSLSLKEANNIAPLYLYPEEVDLDQSRRVNMDPTIRAQIETAATASGGAVPDEVAIFDYIYGVLHCPAYRETYAEFLKIDFPRIPYPTSPDSFADISAKGGALRRLHLMEAKAIGETPYPFEGTAPDGEDSLVGKPVFVETGGGVGRVVINGTAKTPGQYFDAVPAVAWAFFIGGYQPAQKWLKDRKGRELSFDDIRHYQKIIKILSETDRIMQTIEMDLAAG